MMNDQMVMYAVKQAVAFVKRSKQTPPALRALLEDLEGVDFKTMANERLTSAQTLAVVEAAMKDGKTGDYVNFVDGKGRLRHVFFV
jgi:hypothetical protein